MRAKQPRKQTRTETPKAAALRLSMVVAHARKSAGISQQQLAERLGVHHNTVWGWEHGKPLSLEMFFRLCDAIAVKPDEMIRRMVMANNSKP